MPTLPAGLDNPRTSDRLWTGRVQSKWADTYGMDSGTTTITGLALDTESAELVSSHTVDNDAEAPEPQLNQKPKGIFSGA